MPVESRPRINRMDDRARQWLERGGIDAVILTSPMHVYYFTGYYLWLDEFFREYMVTPGASAERLPTYAVAASNAETALIVGGGTASNAAGLALDHVVGYGSGQRDSDPTGLESIQRDTSTDAPFQCVTAEAATAVDGLVTALREMGLADATIGLEVDDLAPAQRAAIEAALPDAKLKDCSNVLRMLRMVKHPDEIDRMRQAAAIAERAAGEVWTLAKPGVDIQDVIAAFGSRVGVAGATFEHFCYTTGGYGLATEPHCVIDKTEVMMVDWGCILEHYYSDTGCTLMMQEPQGRAADYYQGVRLAVQEGGAAFKPGVKASDVRQAMDDSLNRTGNPIQLPHGHGLGLVVRDYPIIMPDNGLRITDDCIDLASDVPIEKDMVINLECGIVQPGYGGWHCEHSFLVTDRGSELLTPQARDEPIIP